MADNIRIFPFGKYDASVHLEKAKSWGMDEVVVIGRSADGQFLWGANCAKLDTVASMLSVANHRLAELLDTE